MSRRLPPLNALRAFESAARHMSFTRAAEELNVTAAAVGQQVRLLEDRVDRKLFQRLHRGLVLTEAGQALLPGVRDGFDRLAESVDRLGKLDEGGVLTVSVAPSFAAKWLVPRIDRFQAAHPDIDVHLSASMQVIDFGDEALDAAIRYGAGRYGGLFVERVIGETVVPVCSPKLVRGPHAIRKPSDLRHHALLHDASPDNDPSCPDWRMWLRASGVADVDAARGPRFNQSSLVIEAAVSGRGVGLAKRTLASDDIKAGRLVSPFEGVQPLAFAYWFVCPPQKAELRKVRLFRDWLREEAARDR
jgi:LysR family transcriptional regulator, glycine cleavage system transcriptional activator